MLIFSTFYRATVRKRGLCCGPVYVCLSICSCILSRRLKISSFFGGPIDPSF